MTTHDINHTCKHGFIDLQHLSRFRNHILIVMIFRLSPFDVEIITIFKLTPWWWYLKCGLGPLMFVYKQNCKHEVSRWCHPIGRRMSGQTKERVTQNWLKSHQQKENCHPGKQFTERVLKLISLRFDHWKFLASFAVYIIIQSLCYC